MKLTKTDKNRYLYEYAFYDAIRRYNNNASKEENPNLIMMSEGRLYRNNFEDYIKGRGYSMGNLPLPVFKKAVNTIFSERMGYAPYEGRNDNFNRQFQDYKNMTGLVSGAENEVDDEDCYLPISPYDPRFAMNDAVLEHGSRLGGIPMSGKGSPVFASDLETKEGQRNAKYMANLSRRENSRQWKASDSGKFLMSVSDLLGMTRLKRFMSASDYETCSNWVAKGFDLANTSMADFETQQRSLDRAEAILNELDELGYDVTIKPDKRPGQLEAVVANTKVKVRVLDTPQSAQMIGRVYDNGVFYLLKTTMSNSISDAPTPTVDEAVSMVRYALGEPVMKPGTNEPVGSLRTYTRLNKGKEASFYTSYRNMRGSHATLGRRHRDVTGAEDTKYNNQLYINADATGRSMSTQIMLTTNDADTYLREAIESARTNYSNMLDVERIIDHVANHKDDDDFAPELSGDAEIAAIQQSYYDVLLGNAETLMRPGKEAEEFEELLEEGEVETDGVTASAMYSHELSKVMYPDESMTPEEIVRAHAEDSLEYQIGDYLTDVDGTRFNPVGVSKFMTSPYGVYRNNDDLIKAMRMLGIEADELKGEGFYVNNIKSKLIKFDKDSAIPMHTSDSEFMRGMYDEIARGLEANGVLVEPDDVQIDGNGIVHYKGMIATAASVTAKEPTRKIEGEIGQIFEPDEHGVLYTKFAGIQNYAAVPGYEAHILRPAPGNPQTVEERTRLMGYEQVMRRNIRYQLRQDFISISRDGSDYGSPTSVNNTYRHLYDERHDLDFVDKFKEQGMEEDMLWAIVKTESQRVRYSNAVRDGSTIHADYMAKAYNRDMANDNTGDTYVLTGGRNMAILTEESDGYFDPVATTATSTNQGTLRYLVDGAKVDADGRIIPSEDKNDRCAIMHHSLMRYMEFNPFDRQNMTVSNLLQASAVTKPVNVAQMTFGGWTMDDQVVITKRFADSYKIRKSDGTLRSMVNGDKITDPYGNKGVVYVMDENMSDEEASEAGVLEQVKWLRANPDLDMVMAPFPAVSRFNGGTARELMENPQDLVSPDGEVIKGAMGSMRVIVTDKSADAKTHVYDNAEHGGRKFSAQAAWAANAKDCPAIMRECFGNNGSSMSNLRELLISCGLDISEAGQFRVGYHPHDLEERRVMEMPDLIYRNPPITKDGMPSVNAKEMNKAFAELIGKQGGVLELPFELKYPTGEAIAPMNDGKTNVVYTKTEWERKGYTRKDGVYVRPTTVKRHLDSGTRQTDGVSWGLPLMSSYLRTGQSFDDGTSTVHDYTHYYIDVFQHANTYRACKERLKDKDVTDTLKAQLEKRMEMSQAAAQASFDRVTHDVIQRSFTGKHNVFRDEIMARKMPNSATAIWTADPRLDIDQVAVGRAMADKIGLKDDEYVMIWRDPILRDGGLRYLRAKIDDSLTGVAINPVMDKSFDGDFDGDTVAVVNLKSEAAKKEAYKNFSVEANLLDTGVKSDDKEKPFGLFMQQSLDVKVAFANNPNLKKKFENMEAWVNSFEADGKAGDLWNHRKDAVKMLSGLYKESFKDQCGKAVISYDSPEAHLQSVKEACIDTGAKGKPQSVLNYMKWAGMDAPNAKDMDFKGAVMNEHTGASRADNQETMYACAVKSFGTGVAGAYSQRGVSAGRNECMKAILELTYPVTQSLLQSKHNAEEAKQKYNLLMGPVRDLWRGAYMSRDSEGRWATQKESNGELVAARRDEWVETFKEMYSKDLNVEINPDYVETVADMLVDGDGYIQNMESSEFNKVSALDKLAYGGKFEDLLQMCRDERYLFEGKNDRQFAPFKIKYNVAVQKEMDMGLNTGEFDTFGKSDVTLDGVERKVKSGQKVSVKRRYPEDVTKKHNGSNGQGHGGLGE